jgi:hypothetical protein
MNMNTDRTDRKKANSQDEIYDMISDYQYDIGIGPHFEISPFFKVFHKDAGRENH